jgi:putative transcriptional regulator
MMGAYISNTVQKMRTDAGVTQEELAEKVGVSRQTVIAIERGRYTPSVLLALKIARHFKVPVETIFSIAYEK